MDIEQEGVERARLCTELDRLYVMEKATLDDFDWGPNPAKVTLPPLPVVCFGVYAFWKEYQWCGAELCASAALSHVHNTSKGVVSPLLYVLTQH